MISLNDIYDFPIYGFSIHVLNLMSLIAIILLMFVKWIYLFLYESCERYTVAANKLTVNCNSDNFSVGEMSVLLVYYSTQLRFFLKIWNFT